MRVKFTVGRRIAGELHFGNGSRTRGSAISQLPLDATNDQLEPTYLAERGVLVNGELESARGFDKYLITLTAGALALSITFVHTLAPQPKHTPILCAAWILFSVSLVIMLVCFLVSQYAYRRQRDVLDKWYTERGSFGNDRNLAATLVDVFNITALVLFSGGVLMLALFSISNFK